MRIRSLDLLAFGPFTNKTLDFDKGKPGLHVVHGPNEAGKSSTLRALKGWLFGIPVRSADNFLHDNAQLRIGGVLELQSGRDLACVRRKGNKNTILDPETDEPLADDILSTLLPGLDETLFSRLHGIDHEALVDGGQAILEQTGDLGKSLFSAALGSQGWNDLPDQLGDESGRLFKVRGSTQAINASAAKLKEAKRVVKEAMVTVKTWKDLRTDQKAAEESVAEIEKKVTLASRQKSRLERFKRVAGTLVERRGVAERKSALGDVLVLPADFGEQWRSAHEKRARASEQLRKAKNKLEPLTEEARGLDVPQELLDNSETIERLHLQLGAVQKQDGDKAKQDARQQDHRRAAGNALKQIRPDLELADAEQLRPLLNKKKTLASLAESFKLLEQKTADLDTVLHDLREEQEGLQKELDTSTGRSGDVVPLSAAVTTARRSGDVGAMLLKAREKAENEEQSCGRGLSRLGRFKGSLQELVALSTPEVAILDEFDKCFSELDEQIRDRKRSQTEVSQNLEEDKSELEALLRISEVPLPEDLEQARERRERGWKLIRTHYVDDQETGSEADEYAGDQALPDAYEESVARADEVADRFREVAEQVQQRGTLEDRIQKAQKNIKTLVTEESEQAEASGRLKADWQAAWVGITDEVGTPRAMKEWLQRAETVLHRVETLETVLGEARRLESVEQAHIEKLRIELLNLDPRVEVEAVGLEELLTRSEQIIDETESAARRRGEIRKELQKLEIRLNRAADDRKQAENELGRWKAEWSRAAEGLGIGENPLPAQAIETMERLEQLFEELNQADDAQRRIHGMEKEEERFDKAVREFAGRIGFDMDGQDPGYVVLQLVARLGKARADSASLEKLKNQIRELEEEIDETKLNIQVTEDLLTDLRALAGVETDEEVGPAEKRSTEYRALAERLDSLEQHLRQAGDGLDIGELEAEAQDQDPDLADGQIERLEAELEEFRTDRDTRRDELRTVINRIEELDGSSRAAEAAEQAEQLVAGIAPDVEQYLRLELARLILADQMEKYRKENQTPVLRRAGELFAKLTLGSFSGLRDDLDDKGNPILLGVRPDNTEVTVEGMSDGSRDQLFLALRLATLEMQLEKGEPVPFVVDDILVGFDDPRSKACLEVLSELARKTQVLVFTHHEAVAGMARELGEDAGVFVQKLA